VPERKTRSVTASQVRSYLGKAEEFLDSALDSLASERHIAATSLAIHAAINASDVITGVRLGRRAAGQDHDEPRRLLQQCGPAGGEAAKNLGRLLTLKTRAEYEPR
jgi:hypothetical protein